MTIDAVGYRRVMGHFATGVTVVTMAVKGRLHGMTANAVSSVSLDPLMLLVCVGKGSATHDLMSRADAFAVNILAADQEHLAELFARRGGPEIGSLRGATFDSAPAGSPRLTGCLAWLECSLAGSVAAGDHTIFLGNVLAGEVCGEAQPLLYYRGEYRHRLA